MIIGNGHKTVSKLRTGRPTILYPLFFWQTPSRKSQAGTQVRISDLEFSLETHFPTIHPPTHPPGKVFVSYVGGRFLNKSCLSILVGIKNGYCNSWWPKYGPQVPKEWFQSIYPLILWQSKTERKLIADWGPKCRRSLSIIITTHPNTIPLIHSTIQIINVRS